MLFRSKTIEDLEKDLKVFNFESPVLAWIEEMGTCFDELWVDGVLNMRLVRENADVDQDSQSGVEVEVLLPWEDNLIEGFSGSMRLSVFESSEARELTEEEERRAIKCVKDGMEADEEEVEKEDGKRKREGEKKKKADCKRKRRGDDEDDREEEEEEEEVEPLGMMRVRFELLEN